jgi:carboxymethylenebutenolidase
MGGFASFLAACRTDVATAVCFYPGGLVKKRQGIGFEPILSEAANIKSPILLLFGDQDQGIPADEVAAVGRTLSGLGKKQEVVVYPGAGHGFFCDQRPSYHEPSSIDAWKRVTRWLEENLAL